MKARFYLKILLQMLVVLVVTGCARAVSAYYPPKPGDSTNKTVYVVNSYGWHTSIVVAVQDIDPSLHLYDVAGDARYVEVGWGDETYYQATRTTSLMGMQALFWPTDSVLHVVLLDKDPAGSFPDAQIVALELSEGGFERLVEFIDNSFAVDQKGQLIRLGRGLYGDSYFYRAEGTFYFFRTCNTWTADVVRASGYPITTFSVVSADHVMKQLKEGER